MYVRPLIEYLAERLRLDTGNRRMEFSFTDGDLRQADFGHSPVRNAELEAMASLSR